MPLQGKKPFQRLKPPKDLRAHEELFYCKITHEVFREYEEFFDRVILCNSLVWTCSLTGKPGLTFQEALESEKNARLTLKKFPEPLKKPLLFLATLTERGRLNDMCDDVFTFVRDRYFVHEEVEVTLNGIKKLCEVIKVISSEKETRSPGKQDSKSGKKVKNISPDKLKYEVREKELGKTAVVKSQCVGRPKGTYTKATNKLFLKHHTVSEGGVWKVKDEAVISYDLKDFEFNGVFCGPLPKYAASPTKKKVSASPEKKKRSSAAPEETTGKKAVQGKINFKKESEEARLRNLEKEQEEFEKQRLILEQERQKRREELKKRMEEDKERQRAQKLKEREEKKEEKRKLAEYLSSWKKPRDDLECDDLKDLPKPTAIDCNIPQNCFGDAVMILEFLSTFSDLIKLKDSFPNGFTFEHLEKALLESDIQGYFNDLIQLLLTSLFQLSEYEKVNEKKPLTIPVADLKNGMTLNEAEEIANAASLWPQTYHGTALQNMPLDSFSVTEILRLHILASGCNKNSAFAQGVSGISEDPGLYFKLEEYPLLQKLATTSIFQLNCEERVKILTLLVQQLACCESFRNHIDDNCPKTRPLYFELKQLRWAYSRQQKEDEALNNVKKKTDKDGKNSDGKLTNGEEESVEEQNQLTLEEKQALEEKHKKEVARRQAEFLRKEREIKAQIQQLQSSYQAVPLGRDRAFRRFWVFNSLPGLFVEDDDKHIGSCLLKETPQVPANATINRSDGSVGSIRKYLQHLGDNKNGSSDKENDILQDLAIIQSDFSIPLKGRKLADLNTRVDLKKTVLDNSTLESSGCLQCKEKVVEFQDSMPWYCPHLKTSSIYGLCTASIDTCPVHNLNAPRTKWSFYCKPEELDTLVNTLNPRGFREGALRKALIKEKEMLLEMMSKCPYNALNKSLPPPPQLELRKSLRSQVTRKSEFANMKPEEALEWTFRDIILELEHRIYAGGLGTVKVTSREVWRAAIEKGSRDLEADKTNVECKPKEESDRISSVIKELALALLEVSDGIEIKFLLPPLSDSDAFKQLKEKSLKTAATLDARQKTREAEGEMAQNTSVKIPKSSIERWQESLMQCTSFPQLFVHLGTLERSVAWSRSVLKAHCRICRRRGDAENMLLCDECNRGHHLYCLKPPLEKIPDGDWFCLSCRPPEKVLTPKKKNVNYTEEGDDDSEESDNEEDESSVQSDYEESEKEMEEDEEGSDSMNEFGDEVCESCGGTGTVICCDRCPKVYHPECIGLRRIPRGEWLCPECTKKAEVIKKTQRHSPTGNYSTRAQTLLDKNKMPVKPAALRTKIQIKAAKRKRSDSSDSESPVTKRTRHNNNKKDAEMENPFKKVYKDSALNILRRRSKSSGATDMLDYKTCLDLLVELMHHPSGWPFLVPVSKKDAPDYHLIIKRPMDFGTIRSKLNNMTYKSNDDFVRDLYLVLQNCEFFNPRYSPEYKAARVLHKEVQRLLKEYQVSHTVR